MLRLFAENLLPVFLAAGVGYLLASRIRLDPRSLTRVAFLVFAPCLVFRILVENELGEGAVAVMLGFTVAVLVIPGLVAFALARILGWSRTLTAAVVLVVMLPNAGNYGLSATLFAFGESGLAHAGVFFVGSSIVTFTGGVFVASLGRSSLWRSLAGLPKVPAVWAVVAAVVVIRTGAALPFPVERTVNLLADACIPVFLIILGIQLHGAGWRGRGRPLALAVGLRLVGGVAIAILLAPLLGLEGPARQAGILEAAMPSAVVTIILANEYDVEPDLVTSAVLITTLLSPLTLTPLLRWLGA